MRSKPNKEEFLNLQLRKRDIETYFPCVHVQPANPRARKRKAYFPGYLFIKADLDEIGNSVLKWTPGSMGLVDFDGDPASVPDHIVEMIRRRVDQTNVAGSEKIRQFSPGDHVAILSGPLANYRAIFDTHIHGRERVLVLLQLLEDQQVSVELPLDQIGRLVDKKDR